MGPERIVLVRSLPGLGDFLCAVPAFRALRAALPQAQIALVGLPPTGSLLPRFANYLDEWLEFPGYPGIPEVPLAPQKTIAFLAAAQALNFDLALQLHGSGTHINGFTRLLGARRTAGFFPPDQPCPDPSSFLPYPDQTPEVCRYLRLLEFLGIPPQGTHLEFPLLPADWTTFNAIATLHHLMDCAYVCVHPGASVNHRRWLPQNFATVADAIAARGFRIVLTGSASEANLTRAVQQAMQFPAIDLAGKTNLGSLAALLKQSQLLVCNDTGVSHLADALQVRSVVVFCNSDPNRWAPLNRQRHWVIAPERQDWVEGVVEGAIAQLRREVVCAS